VLVLQLDPRATRFAALQDRAAVGPNHPDEERPLVANRVALLGFVAVVACSEGDAEPQSDLPGTAESFFAAVYGCAPERIPDLAAPEVSISYPIFSTLYGTPVIRGVQAITEFSRNFCRRWSDGVLSVEERIVQDGRAALVWSFTATDRLVSDSSEARQSWGGISVFRFDEDGRVVEEFGEESDPGPTARRSTAP